MVRVAVALALLCLACRTHAGEDDLSALDLADSVPASVAQGSEWRAFAEASGGQVRSRGDGALHYARRLSLDLRYDHALDADWRLLFADRLDANWPAQVADENAINTLKEAYLSWRAQPDLLLDLGRINVRHGVAMGYNPTDYFRAGAVRSVVSIEPASLKENRQGSFMGRAQWLWDRGSITLLSAPKLETTADKHGFNPNWGGTNNQNRWLLVASPRLGDNINPQLLLYREAGRPVQLGVNLTALLDDATVAFLEWSGGRGDSLLTQALRQAGVALPERNVFRNRIATGATHTTADKLSLTAELEYSGAALKDGEWQALGKAIPAYWQYRGWLQGAQEMPTRKAVFVHGGWRDALVTHLDLNAMVRRNGADGSSLTWIEARYHWNRSEIAVQWQIDAGSPGSEFGAVSQRRAWQLQLRQYL